jgi:hypothetical protein
MDFKSEQVPKVIVNTIKGIEKIVDFVYKYVHANTEK